MSSPLFRSLAGAHDPGLPMLQGFLEEASDTHGPLENAHLAYTVQGYWLGMSQQPPAHQQPWGPFAPTS